jgi:rare lipoprotein A (peptidoglycan hydrolase)
VTDRGPWVKNAVLDLSHAAARTLGFSGSAKVRIDRVDRPHYTAVQVAQLEMPQKPGVAGQ